MILRKLHIKLTFLCAGITIFIMCLMSCIYLYIAEKNLRQNSFLSFETDMDTLVSHIEEQSVISYEYLSKLESGGKYTIHLWDNGTPLQFNQRAEESSLAPLFDTTRDYYDTHFSSGASLNPYTSVHRTFALSSSGKRQADYYACVASVFRENGTLQVCVLKSLAPLQAQIRTQRLSFLALILLSSVALFLFSYYFTRKLLQPVAQKQKQQLEFVSAASHELRTPLAVLLSAASACRSASPQEQETFFHIIEEEGADMSRLISDMLTLAEADEQHFPMFFSPCEPDTLLLNVYESYTSRASHLGYHLKIKLPDASLPTVNWDESRIRQVLSILIENAFSYTPSGSTITLSVLQKDKNIRLLVQDNGPGIPDDRKNSVFDRFYRADPARSKNGHFGLGLSIAYELITAHKGTIRVTDAAGGGALFTITLPGNLAPSPVEYPCG